MTCCVFERGIIAAVAAKGSMTTLMLGEDILSLVMGEEELTLMPAEATTEGSILQKMSRALNFLSRKQIDDRIVEKSLERNR